MLQEIGLEQVAEHVAALAQALIQGARELGIHIKTPLDSVGPLVVLQSHDVEKAIARLAEENIVVSAVSMDCGFPSTYTTRWMICSGCSPL